MAEGQFVGKFVETRTLVAYRVLTYRHGWWQWSTVIFQKEPDDAR